jgi:hypothetical protein
MTRSHSLNPRGPRAQRTVASMKPNGSRSSIFPQLVASSPVRYPLCEVHPARSKYSGGPSNAAGVQAIVPCQVPLAPCIHDAVVRRNRAYRPDAPIGPRRH